MRNDTISNPDQSMLDDALLYFITLSDAYKTAYRELKEITHFMEKEVDKIVNERDENGKKLYTYRTHAESHINELHRDKADRLAELEIQRKELETDLDLQKMIYYHAKAKLSENTMIDSQTSIQGKNSDLY